MTKLIINILDTRPGRTDFQAKETAAALKILSADELQRYQRFRFEEDRRQYALAHALLRRSLTDWFPHRTLQSWRFRRSGQGKPLLVDGSGLDFSITHTRGLVACALTDAGSVGLDAEPFDRKIEFAPMLEEVCSTEEINELQSLAERDRKERFLQIWSLKEAVLKALGTGLQHKLGALTLAFQEDGSVRLRAASTVAFPNRLVRLITNSDYAIAYCLLCAHPADQIAVHWPSSWQEIARK